MAYQFSGVIGFTDKMDFNHLGGVSRAIDTPFSGRVHAFAVDHTGHELADWELNALQAWSADHPEEWLIYLRVECFGGDCEEMGFVLKAGAVRADFDWGQGHLQKLFAAAQCKLDSPILPFLERNYFTFDDEAHMRRTIALARTHHGQTGANPSVGCVVVSPTGQVLGEDVTGIGGTPHAEEAVLTRLGHSAKGATVYVTLEPCRQRSKGGASCSELLVNVGVNRVVCAVPDKHPNGQGGFDRLKSEGIVVDVGLCEDEAADLYEAFFDSL